MWGWVYFFLDLDLPGVRVDPNSNSTPLDMAWECYSHYTQKNPKPTISLYYAAREGGKTLTESVVEVMHLLHFGGEITHLAAIERQSTDSQKYIKNFLNKPHFIGFVEGDSVRTTEVVTYRHKDPDKLVLNKKEYEGLTSYEKEGYNRFTSKTEVVVATIKSVNGKHGKTCYDELDLIPPDVYNESKNINSPIKLYDGRVVPNVTILTSTRKYSVGLVENEIKKAPKTGMKIRHWSLIDVTQKCPKEKHKPELKKLPIYYSEDDLSTISEEQYESLDFKAKENYQKDESFDGCLNNCTMFAMCRGKLAKDQTGDSDFLKPIEHTEHQFKNGETDINKAQLMCWKPTSAGKVYDKFNREIHVISPAECYKRITGEYPPNPKKFKKEDLFNVTANLDVMWAGGVDFGFTHFFSATMGFIWGRTAFITHQIAYSELDPEQQIEVCEPLRPFYPSLWCDTSMPLMIKALRNNGFRTRDWSKGEVADGINIVKLKLSPGTGDPELLIVVDPGGDPAMEVLIDQFESYAWKILPNGAPSNKPNKKEDDCMDSTRYLIENVFGKKTKLKKNVVKDRQNRVDLQNRQGANIQYNKPENGIYDPKKWQQQVLSEKIPGYELNPSERRMTISYYNQDNNQDNKEPKKMGRKRKIRFII